MLEGYDDDWQNAPKDRIATYSGVPGGTYKFKVKAFLLESPDKYDMRTITIIVPPHFLLSTTAIWIYLILLAALAIFLMIRYQDKLRRKIVGDKPTIASMKKEEEATDEYEVIDASDLEE